MDWFGRVDWESVGLWLGILGAVLALGGLWMASPRRNDMAGGLSSRGLLDSWKARLGLALTVTGAWLAAVGSAITAVSNAPQFVFAVATVVVATVSVYAILVWKLHQLRRAELELARTDARSDPSGTHPVLDRAERQATWRWCLAHPLERRWPGAD